MRYQDITLSPDDIEWERTSVWDAARDSKTFDKFVRERGLEEVIRHFHKAHRAIADKLIEHQVSTGKEFPEASQWIFAARTFKNARKKATRAFRELHGDDETRALQTRLNSMYVKSFTMGMKKGRV